MLWSTDIDLIARAGIDLIGSEPVQNQLVSLQINKEESKHNSVTAIIPRVFKYYSGTIVKEYLSIEKQRHRRERK
jgi:predicted YcjX-like family ATPase